VISGDEYDGHSLLVQRLFHTRLKTLSEQRRGAQKAGPFPPVKTRTLRFDSLATFQTRLSRHLRETFEALVEGWRDHAFVALELPLDAGALGSDLGEFIRWFADDFRAEFMSAGPQFVGFLSLSLPRSRGSWRFWEPSAKDKVERQLQQWFPGFPENAQMAGNRAAMLLNLGTIELPDLKQWVEDRELYQSRERAHEEARRIFDSAVRRSGVPVRMDTVYEELVKFWRSKGNAARTNSRTTASIRARASV